MIFAALFIILVLALFQVRARPWYGPQGFQCVDNLKSSEAPKVALFFEETSLSRDGEGAEGNLKMYGISKDGRFHKVEDAVYTVFKKEGKQWVIPTFSRNVISFARAMDIKFAGEYHNNVNGGLTDEVIFFTESSRSKITFNYESCYISLGNQNYCSETGITITVGVNTGDLVNVTRTLNFVADGKDPAAVEFVLIGKKYPFPLSVVENSGKSLEKLLKLMDSNTESSKESFWTEGNPLVYDPLRNAFTLHQDYKSSNDVEFTAC